MDTAIKVALITGAFGLAGSVLVAVISAITTKTAVTHKLETSQAVTDTKIDELTREVRKHNNFAERVPVIESQMKEADRRLSALEKKGA